MKKEKKRYNNTCGVIMMESLVVYTEVIFLLFFLLAIFGVLFQRWTIQIIANDAVTRVAQTYKLTEADVLTGYTETEEIREVRDFRYILFAESFREDIKTRLDEYASNRLIKSTFTNSVSDPEIEMEVIHDSLARRHIKLTIKGEYSVPGGEALSYFGFDSTTKYEVSAYADCVDIIDYVNTIDYVDRQTSLKALDSKVIKAINSILKFFKNRFQK